jgi:hypothetical protein
LSLANLSCWQLRRGQAVYHPEWDNGGRIAKACQTRLGKSDRPRHCEQNRRDAHAPGNLPIKE